MILFWYQIIVCSMLNNFKYSYLTRILLLKNQSFFFLPIVKFDFKYCYLTLIILFNITHSFAHICSVPILPVQHQHQLNVDYFWHTVELSNCFNWSADRTLTSTTVRVAQWVLVMNGYSLFLESNTFSCSLVSYGRHSLSGSYPSAEMQ